MLYYIYYKINSILFCLRYRVYIKYSIALLIIFYVVFVCTMLFVLYYLYYIAYIALFILFVLFVLFVFYYIILLYYTVFALRGKLKNIGGVSPIRKAKIPPPRFWEFVPGAPGTAASQG